MEILKKINLYLIIVISIAAGVAKVIQVPAEVEFLESIGLSVPLIIALGLIQIGGGVLLSFSKTRKRGAIVALGTLFLSTIFIFMKGDIAFGFFSVLPVIMSGLILRNSDDTNPGSENA